MDPFIQHFNNIFLSSPLYETFEECEDALSRVCRLLDVEYLT